MSALTVVDQTEQLPMTAADIRAQVNLVQEVMAAVMRKDEHFGIVPGCGDKPTLLQPGAQKLLMTFRLVPDPEMTLVSMPNGHREVRCKVKLYTQRGTLLGAGVGTCSTMESKYRFRTGPVEFTDRPVPREYWDLRSSNPAKARAMLGEGMVAKKNEAGAWVCARQGEKVEHDNPADYFNTVEKIAYKRALVSATLTVTAASDIFTQDIEDLPEGTINRPESKPAQAQPPAQKKAETVLDKMKANPAPSQPAQAEAKEAKAADSGYDAEWLSKVMDAEDFLRNSQVGKGKLAAIRAGFNLTGDAYPMFPDAQAEYLSILNQNVNAMQKNA